jgi:hypothetical protein
MVATKHLFFKVHYFMILFFYLKVTRRIYFKNLSVYNSRFTGLAVKGLIRCINSVPILKSISKIEPWAFLGTFRYFFHSILCVNFNVHVVDEEGTRTRSYVLYQKLMMTLISSSLHKGKKEEKEVETSSSSSLRGKESKRDASGLNIMYVYLPSREPESWCHNF